MANPKKSRDGHARKPSKDQPAIVEPMKDEPPAEQPREYDPKPIVERLDVWSLNGKDRYFLKDEKAQRVLSVNEKDVKRKLRLAGIHSRAGEGKSHSQADVVMDYILTARSVDHAGPLAGKRVGMHSEQGRRILVTSSYRLVEPCAGDWPILRAFLTGLFTAEGIDQTPYIFAWLKVGITALRAGKRRPGHCLVMAGPSNCGKSFFQEHVATPLLGDRMSNPKDYVLGVSRFNGEMGGTEHLAIQELPSSLKSEDRAKFGENLKRLVATESHSIEPKHCEAITLYPWWRVSISINSNIDKLKMLPPLSSDFGDKVLLLLCEALPMPMPTATTEEREAFLSTITAELPAFVAFLLSWEIPTELLQTKHASRFGHDHFHHPRPVAALFDQEPQSALLHILDDCPELYKEYPDGAAWGWGKAELLAEQLCDDAQFGRFSALARKICGAFPNACATYLGRLEEKYPDRFKSKHSTVKGVNGNFWLIGAP